MKPWTKVWIFLFIYSLLTLGLIASMLFLPTEPKHYIVDDMHCYGHRWAIDCNIEKYNHDTKFGEFPYAREIIEGVEDE